MALQGNNRGVLVFSGTGLERAMEELEQICRVPEQIQELITKLNDIKALLKDAERRQSSSHKVRLWFLEIKQIFLDAEDLVDDFATDAAVRSIGPHTYSSPTITEDRMRQIREISDRLDHLEFYTPMLGLQTSIVKDSHLDLSSWRQTSSLESDETSVIGREREKTLIIRKLLSSTQVAEPSSNNGGFSILPIVGMGGIGKTTLARLVFNDWNVKKYFSELMMWVCVSNVFDLKILTKDMIEVALAFTGNYPQYQVMDWDSMQERLRREVEGKTFLLVLDDVWEAEQFMWEELLKPLHFGKKGSKILVTSRDRDFVSKMQGRTDPPIELKGLSDDDIWLLFKRYALKDVIDANGTTSAEYFELEPIGRSIVQRLGGSPLAARTIGSLLNNELDVQHWKRVQESEFWSLEQGKDDILPALQLSYQYLCEDLKQCFAYCSLFPKDHEFSREQVVEIWEAQSFIRKNRSERMDALGDQKAMETHDTIRHISVCVTELDQTCLNEFSYGKLRTLLFLRRYYSSDFYTRTHDLDELFLKLKMLRVLVLPSCGIEELPASIGDLKQLRYIDLKENEFLKSLPESFGNLYNLQVLNLNGCHSLSELPATTSQLVNLRHLRADYDLGSNIYGLGKLTGLEELHVGGRRVRELGGMCMLRELTVHELEEVASKEDAMQARLQAMEHLQVLHLEWGDAFFWPRDSDSMKPGVEEEVLQALQPNDSIEKLQVEGYGGIKSPHWMEVPMSAALSSLRQLVLGWCPNWRVLPSSLSQLPHLESLTIRQMPEWEEWSCPVPCDSDQSDYNSQQDPSSAMSYFPCLHELEVKHCPKLKEIPLLPPMLKRLHLEEVGLSCLPALWEPNCGGVDNSSHLPPVSASLCTLLIHSCDNLTSISRLLQHHLPDLENIEIKECENLVSLPERGFGHLISLKGLCTTKCPKLTCPVLMKEGEDAPSQHLPGSLEQLEINQCGNEMGGWWWVGLQHLTSIDKLSLSGCPTTIQCLFVRLGRRQHPYLLETLRELVIKGCGRNYEQQHTTLSTSSYQSPPSNPLVDASAGAIRALTSLTHLTIKDCPNVLRQWGGGGLPSSLERLTITGDDNLDHERLSTCLHNLISLKRLKLGHLQNLYSLPDLSGLTSLDTLDMKCCPSFQRLAVMSLPSSLKQLNLKDFKNLHSLPDTLCCLTSLKYMYISDCPSIETLVRMSLPSSLKELTFKNFKNLHSLPDTLDCLSSLEFMWISGCPSIQLLPDTMSSLSSLRTLYISNCASIQSLPDTMSGLSSLLNLQISNCISIQSLPDTLSSLSFLRILEISSCPSIQSLPDTLSRFSSLDSLRIFCCPSIQSLPTSGLPPSLKNLRISECPALTGRHEHKPKSMWPEVSHVLWVSIDGHELK
ncbi:hypothetical protein Taro_029591 [Colocasia esculenta]|uniref:Uncharacterized protein n=1 Tax=Colocasia esculenta TaxID=4460 RepID=A0A843VPH8_COLES|nr:hypothetical protein [Colocasia esculenta]